MAYRESILDLEIGFEMVPIPGGVFVMGSPDHEVGRRADEGPTHEVEVESFWIGRTEVGWGLYRPFMLSLDREQRRRLGATPIHGAPSPDVDAVSRPTPPYVPMDFGMGVEGHPAISMTQFAARHFTKWLSVATGRFYRLPSEAEWEYACRASGAAAYGFGANPADLDRRAWHRGNSAERYHKLADREPDWRGVFDLHGNVAEWTLDRYDPEFYRESPRHSPVAWPSAEHPRVVRGGSFEDEPTELRCAARRASSAAWKRSDPQFPQSIWYLTNAPFVGFRVVRPLREPSAEERERAWEPDVDSIRQILERQREENVSLRRGPGP